MTKRMKLSKSNVSIPLKVTVDRDRLEIAVAALHTRITEMDSRIDTLEQYGDDDDELETLHAQVYEARDAYEYLTACLSIQKEAPT